MTISSTFPIVPETAAVTPVRPSIRPEAPYAPPGGPRRPPGRDSVTTRAPGAPGPVEAPRGAREREEAELRAAVEAANERLRPSGAVIAFHVDPDTKRLVTSLLDARTNEVLRQLPSKAVLELARALDQIAPLLVQQKA
ncbi:MAG: flagellar protein FlaG [Verrucomicrobia bacterium]|nr:flagellar protein FlaG [Verrucomicrobiota bacterium]